MLIRPLVPPAARLRRGGPLRAPVEDAEINRTGRTEPAPPHRCTSKLTLSSDPGRRSPLWHMRLDPVKKALDQGEETVRLLNPWIVSCTLQRNDTSVR